MKMRRAVLIFVILFESVGFGQPAFSLARLQRQQTPWEVAVVFLGARENENYQRDIDHNVLDLARSNPNRLYRLSVYRELPERTVEYFVDPYSQETHPWSSLFFNRPAVEVQVPGRLTTNARQPSDRSILERPMLLERFFSRAFANPRAFRVLIVYSHGEAFDGLGHNISLAELKRNLHDQLPKRLSPTPLDILWFDACFMANLETLFELRDLSQVIVGSEEAEFSAGLPFDALRFLGDGPNNPERVARELAERFIESYSYIKRGQKRKAVFSSSATISVVNTKLLRALIGPLKAIAESFKRMGRDERKALSKRLETRRMERQDLVDLGSLLQVIQKSEQTPTVRQAGEKALRLIEMGKPERFETTPRLLVVPTVVNDRMVFGYNDWSDGYQGDSDSLQRMPTVLREGIEFVDGIKSKRWPSRFIEKELYFSPFSVGMNLFHYYFQTPAGKLSGKVVSFQRDKDYVFFRADDRENPILLSGYTQGIGENAERYSGLSILDPTVNVDSIDYPYLEFVQATGWGQP